MEDNSFFFAEANNLTVIHQVFASRLAGPGWLRTPEFAALEDRILCAPLDPRLIADASMSIAFFKQPSAEAVRPYCFTAAGFQLSGGKIVTAGEQAEELAPQRFELDAASGRYVLSPEAASER